MPNLCQDFLYEKLKLSAFYPILCLEGFRILELLPESGIQAKHDFLKSCLEHTLSGILPSIEAHHIEVAI